MRLALSSIGILISSRDGFPEPCLRAGQVSAAVHPRVKGACSGILHFLRNRLQYVLSRSRSFDDILLFVRLLEPLKHFRDGRLGRCQITAVGEEENLNFLDAIGKVDAKVGLHDGAVRNAPDL